jgi:hypothetical protein
VDVVVDDESPRQDTRRPAFRKDAIPFLSLRCSNASTAQRHSQLREAREAQGEIERDRSCMRICFRRMYWTRRWTQITCQARCVRC